MKPIRRDQKDEKENFLRRKWGFTNYNINSALEHSHQDMLNMVQDSWELLSDGAKDYYKSKMEWEDKWKRTREEENM